MVFLEKTWFTPVGKVLDERDGQLRSQLSGVKGNADELAKLTSEAEALVRAARSEVSAMILKQKNAKQAELDKMCAAARPRVVVCVRVVCVRVCACACVRG
jgi:F-type H+-transporting ATPase subunit b